MKYRKSGKAEHKIFIYCVPFRCLEHMRYRGTQKTQRSGLSWNIHHKGAENMASLRDKMENEKIVKTDAWAESCI